MSVKVHEAFSIDSFQDRLLFSDDFLGDSLRDLWTASGTGSAVVVDAQNGGVLRFSTLATNGSVVQLDWNNIRSLLVSKKLTFEMRCKTSVSDATLEVYFRLFNTNWIMFWQKTDEANYQIYTNSGGVTQQDSGIAKDTNYHIFRIECFPTGEVHFFIDGVETANSPITTNISAQYLQPSIYVQTKEDAIKTLDVDYIAFRQEI